jgi:rubredoxin
LKSSLSDNNANQQDLLPICPRCESDKAEIVSFSSVKGAWIIYNCAVCFYSWRSAEPDYATKPDRYIPAFKIKVEDIPTFAEVPVIPAL